MEQQEAMNRPAESNEPTTLKVQLDPAVTFSRREVAGRTTYVAHHPSFGKYFQFGAQEYRIAQLLDGARDISAVIAQLIEDGIEWQHQEVAEFVAKLVSSRLAAVVDQPTSPASNSSDQRGPDAMAWAKRFPRWLSLLISQRFPLLTADGVATKIDRKIGWTFGTRGMIAWTILVVSGLMIVYGNLSAFTAELKRMFDPGLWIVLIAMWCVAKMLHEAGHAVAAKHHGVRVGKMGIMFFFLAPLAYVDVTDAWKIRSRWPRIQIALAGIYWELAAAALAAWCWWMLPDGMARHLAAQFILIAGPASLLVNANPLLRLDGYYVLSDLTEIPNLRMHGRKQLASWLEYRLLRIPIPRSLLTGWRKTFATAHAACSVVFQFFWMGGLILAVSIWARGLGIVLAISATLLWGVLPLSRWIYKIWKMEPGVGLLRMNPRRRRLVSLAFILIMAFQYLGSASSPLDRRVPVIIRSRNEQIARAVTDAFVQDVYVMCGQRVKPGTILMILDDPELKVRRDDLVDDLQIAELRIVQFRRQGELAAAAAETEHAASLNRQLDELDEQLDSLQVVAERGGLVISSRLDNLKGRFVEKGEELVRVAEPKEKEVLATVSEKDTQAYQAAANRKQMARIRLRGGTIFNAVPASLRPRATQVLPHPALAATAGGPLAVEAAPQQEQVVRTVQPRMESVTHLDPLTSVEVRSGQVGTMTISDNRSLIARLFDAATAKPR